MNTTQVSPSVETHTEEPLWQEFTEQEQEKICGGAQTPWQERVKWRFSRNLPGRRSLWVREVYHHSIRRWGIQEQKRNYWVAV